MNGTTGFTDDCHSVHPSVGTIALSVFFIVIFLVTLTGNVLVLVAVAMSSYLRERTSTLFIISLACSDLSFALFQIPFKISMTLHYRNFCHSDVACYFNLIADSVVNVSSLLNLLLIAFDR